MDITQFNHLEVGDIVQNTATHDMYTITIIVDVQGKRSYFGVRAQSITNHQEWEQVGKVVPL